MAPGATTTAVPKKHRFSTDTGTGAEYRVGAIALKVTTTSQRPGSHSWRRHTPRLERPNALSNLPRATDRSLPRNRGTIAAVNILQPKAGADPRAGRSILFATSAAAWQRSGGPAWRLYQAVHAFNYNAKDFLKADNEDYLEAQRSSLFSPFNSTLEAGIPPDS